MVVPPSIIISHMLRSIGLMRRHSRAFASASRFPQKARLATSHGEGSRRSHTAIAPCFEARALRSVLVADRDNHAMLASAVRAALGWIQLAFEDGIDFDLMYGID